MRQYFAKVLAPKSVSLLGYLLGVYENLYKVNRVDNINTTNPRDAVTAAYKPRRFPEKGGEINC